MIQTKRLFIRKINVNDYDQIKKILSDPLTMSYWPHPFTSEQVRDWIDRTINNYKEHGLGRYVIELKANGSIIGDVGFLYTAIDGEQMLDLGYIIHSDYWKQGYGYEAAMACLKYGCKQGLKRINANMPYNHHASIRVAEKLGMKKVKTFYNTKNRSILTYLYEMNCD